jgi:hypothetical protein
MYRGRGEERSGDKREESPPMPIYHYIMSGHVRTEALFLLGPMAHLRFMVHGP